MDINTTILLASSVTAVPPSIIAWLAYMQAQKAHQQSLETHKAINSRMDLLLRTTASEATATATLVEKAAELKRIQDSKVE